MSMLLISNLGGFLEDKIDGGNELNHVKGYYHLNKRFTFIVLKVCYSNSLSPYHVCPWTLVNWQLDYLLNCL